MARKKAAVFDLQVAKVFLASLIILIFPLPSHGALRCYDCHGTDNPADSRPLDDSQRNILTGGFRGNHRTHMDAGANAGTCTICHPGSTAYTSNHRDGAINLSGNINSSRLGAVYNNITSSFPQTATPSLGSCDNVNCHFEKVTPTWGSSSLPAPGGCTTCHDIPPSGGSHPSPTGPGAKHREYYGVSSSCTKCHSDHLSAGNPFIHATSAGKRGIDIRFTTPPNSGGQYVGGSAGYPDYLNPTSSGTCSGLYCHSDGRGGPPNIAPSWGGAISGCRGCHRGTTLDSTVTNCDAVLGAWSSARRFCTPPLTMSSNGHERLVGLRWIRQYPCSYCHYATADGSGTITDRSRHVDGMKDVVISPQWAIPGKGDPGFDPVRKECTNVYCHSDGTTNPTNVRLFGWNQGQTSCNTCHGHPQGSCSSTNCHDGRTDSTGKVWVLSPTFGNQTAYRWPAGDEWKAANPMFGNEGPGTIRANSHMRHTETHFTCDHCHAATIAIANGICTDCHAGGYNSSNMSEVAHLNATYHVNKNKDVVFKDGGSYNPVTKTCSNTFCHTSGTDPQWGGSVNSAVTCLSCHGTTDGEVDNFGFVINTAKATINLTEWATAGHGRQAGAGPYPASGNPAAGFPGNPCWYCHDNDVIHNDQANPFRLRKHPQFNNRFEKECVYCHMVGLDTECLACHGSNESLAPKLDSAAVKAKHDNEIKTSGCLVTACHDTDAVLHKSGARFWRPEEKEDIKNQYLMMGVCLKCHDDDSGGKCSSCHPATQKYILGFKPFSTALFIKPQKARASSVHFGYKHYRAYAENGTWKGGKFCWDCHDPHGDTNIYMVQNKVATTTEGRNGIPQTRKDVVFTKKQSGLDYARIEAPYDGICNVCHSAGSQHYRVDSGDGHSASRICTTCHEHRFTDSHASQQSCNSCHQNKPVPRHSGFGLPRDCTKCHAGTIGLRMDVMGQMKANSHHVQGVTVTNRHCYACHWEATPEGLIDVKYHEGYNYKNYSTMKNAKVDLVVWRPGYRPAFYNTTTNVSFLASNIGTPAERGEVAKLNDVCIGCHSDQNNDTDTFGDCKTPRQYSWDGLSVAARYLLTGTTKWGKYNSTTYPKANQKDRLVKALSAHGNAVANQGGYSEANGVDTAIPNTRDGGQNVQCFDCHSSHGSKVTGITTSYTTFNGTHNGGNLKETQAGKGGYGMSYKASANTSPGAVNPFNAGAGQCFDCHVTQNAGSTPWGYQSTFGATAPIKGYFDSAMFGGTSPWTQPRYDFKKHKPVIGGHLKAEAFLNRSTSLQNRINGLCTPCHDPHGVSPMLGDKQAYAVPLLKGTWMTSPYREDGPEMSNMNPPDGYAAPEPTASAHTDQNTFAGGRVTEDAERFAGLCLRCHNQGSLTGGPDKTKPWKGMDRVHQSVKGWGVNDQHSYTCSKCHTPHTSGLPRLMVTNCLQTSHRGGVIAGGSAGSASGLFVGSGPAGPDGGDGSFPRGFLQSGVNCHPTGSWPDNSWNQVTPW